MIPSAPATPASAPSPRERHLLLALVVAAIIIVAAISVYVLTRPPPPIPLTIKDGSTMGTVPWNMTTGSNWKDLVLDFRAMTYANESDGDGSVLGMHVFLYALFDTGCGCIDMNLNVTVSGSFASDLHPVGLDLRSDLIGPNATRNVTLYGGAGLTGTNVSFGSWSQYTYTVNGSISATATVVPQTGKGYNFRLSDPLQFQAPPDYNRTLGFWAIVDGPFVPSVSVGIVLNVDYVA